jgi:hypothetical protein
VAGTDTSTGLPRWLRGVAGPRERSRRPLVPPPAFGPPSRRESHSFLTVLPFSFLPKTAFLPAFVYYRVLALSQHRQSNGEECGSGAEGEKGCALVLGGSPDSGEGNRVGAKKGWALVLGSTPTSVGLMSTPSTRDQQKRPADRFSVSSSATVERQSRTVAVVGVVLLVVFACSAVVATRQVVRTQVGTTLDTLLSATSNGVKIWHGDQVRQAQRLSNRDELREMGLMVLNGTNVDNVATLRKINAFLANQTICVMIVDRDLAVRATSQIDWRLDDLAADAREQLRGALSGTPVVTRPVLIGTGSGRRLIVLFALPIRAHTGTVIEGILLWASDPATELLPLMTATWPNGIGETFLASADGVILTGSRGYDEMRSLGLGSEGTSSSFLNVKLLEPHRHLTAENPLKVDDSLKPTVIARDFAAGRSGRNLDGFLDYRGIEVLGAWQWLPDIGIGVACKLDREYAYHSIWVLELIFFAALITAAIGNALGLMWFRRTGRALRHAWEAQRRADEYNRYEVGVKLGEGGMGTVHRATHARLRRPAAIKVIRSQAVSPENIMRFEREALLTCRLSHPNTIQIFDYGILPDGSLYYVMEYLDGMSLQDLVYRHGPQPPRRVIHLLTQALGALAEAHNLGLIHRDIKPSNLYLTSRGGMLDVIKILDFGLARDCKSTATALTNANTVMGSPSCMPPEQISEERKQLDGRSDLYSLSCVGYWLLTGKNVFDRDSMMVVLQAHLHDDPIPPSQRLGRDVPADLESCILRGLAKRPEDRHRSAVEFCNALMSCTDARQWSDADARKWWIQTVGKLPGEDVDTTIDRDAVTRPTLATE